MKIKWNQVTWYSRIIAIVSVFFVFSLGVYVGVQYGNTIIEILTQEFYILSSPVMHSPSAAGMHCGGFIRNAPTCPANFHCQLKISNPDTGGVCVHD